MRRDNNNNKQGWYYYYYIIIDTSRVCLYYPYKTLMLYYNYVIIVLYCILDRLVAQIKISYATKTTVHCHKTNMPSRHTR